MKNIRIIGAGHKPAEACVTNDMLSEIVDTNDEWITTRTGIKTRYFSENKNTSDLGYEAALKAIEDAGIDKTEIEAIIVATMTPDNAMPSTACLIQEKLGLNDVQIMAFDVNAACNGFITALQVGSSLIGRFKTVLVIGAETNSKILDYSDRGTCILFGDGAGAVVLRYDETANETFMYSNSMGDSKDVLTSKNNGLTPLLTSNQATNNYMTMQGNEVFRFAIRVMEEAIVEVLKLADMSIDDIDCIIPHQANIRIIKHVAKSMNVPLEKFFINLDKYGNTSSASIGIAFSEAKEQGVIKKNDKVILVGFGGGFTYSSYLYQL